MLRCDLCLIIRIAQFSGIAAQLYTTSLVVITLSEKTDSDNLEILYFYSIFICSSLLLQSYIM